MHKENFRREKSNMDSNYFGEQNMGSGSSSRKGKKNNQDKPKQPQRGLGVAQLEKIRLHGEMAYSYHPSLHPPYPSNFNNEDPRVQTPYTSIPSSSSFSYSSSSTTSYSPSHAFQPNIMMGLPQYERTNIRYGDSQPIDSARWEHTNANIAQPNMTRPFLNLYDSQPIDTKKHRSCSMGSSSQNSQPIDSARWEHTNANIAQPNMTRPFLNLYDSQPIDTKKHRSCSMGSSSQNSESSDNQEPDLELRLSL